MARSRSGWLPGRGHELLGARPEAFATNRVGGTAAVVSVAAASAPANGAKVSGPFGTEGAAEAGHLGKAADGHDIWMPAATRAKLEEAQIIVSGGRGLGGPEGFAQIEALATALGASVGASRAAVDAGWIPYAHQVGRRARPSSRRSTSPVASPARCSTRRAWALPSLIIAINKDKDAPIFSFCDLGIVGDLNVVVPQLTAAVKRARAAEPAHAGREASHGRRSVIRAIGAGNRASHTPPRGCSHAKLWRRSRSYGPTFVLADGGLLGAVIFGLVLLPPGWRSPCASAS